MIKSILFLGVGYLQMYSINSAKKAGFNILGVDKNKDAASASLCDYFLNMDCTEFNSIYKWCKSLNHCKIQAVWANNDILIPSRSKLEKKLQIKFPYLSLHKCNELLDKKRAFKILKNTGLMPTKYNLLEALSNKDNFPYIVKPISGSGSKGVSLVNSISSLRKIDFNPKKQLIEKYIQGTEYGTNHFYDGKNVFNLPAVRRYFNHNLTMVPLGTVVADMNNKNIQNCYNLIKKIIIKNNWLGPIKTDVFVNNNNFKILEISPRFHGEIDTTYVFNYCNSNLADIYFSNLSNPKKKFWKSRYENLRKIVGYISLSNKSVINDFNFIKNVLKKYKLKFLFITKSNNSIKCRNSLIPKSTSELVGFVFYSTYKRLDEKKFNQIFMDLNLIS